MRGFQFSCTSLSFHVLFVLKQSFEQTVPTCLSYLEVTLSLSSKVLFVPSIPLENHPICEHLLSEKIKI